EGSGGVRVYYPSRGWTWTEGNDGRRVVYPNRGWTWTEGADGRRVVYPNRGWTWTEDSNGRRIPYRSSGQGPGLCELFRSEIPSGPNEMEDFELLLEQMGFHPCTW
ncbi:MAG: hypothetical protein HRU19_25160, partial [Pseudobacteriovorax sp.]|nr:hypothetical protein [Pseudobacteriovorax sp.]